MNPTLLGLLAPPQVKIFSVTLIVLREVPGCKLGSLVFLISNYDISLPRFHVLDGERLDDHLQHSYCLGYGKDKAYRVAWLGTSQT